MDTWMAMLVGEFGFSPEHALTLGVANEMDHPIPVHHYGDPNSDVDLRNNVGGVTIGLTTTPGIEMVDAEPRTGFQPSQAVSSCGSDARGASGSCGPGGHSWSLHVLP